MTNQRPLQVDTRLWLGLVIFFFIIVYLFSLTFVYIEGDDASSIAHHLLGRSSEIQPPYSAYHAMMDWVLGLLPQNEQVLRVTAMSITAAAALLLVIFTLALIFDQLKHVPIMAKTGISAAVLLAVPEFFYLGLVYLPSVVAMALVLSSHYTLRQAVLRYETHPSDRSPALLALLAVILFGIGAACRWDIAVYGGVIFADLLVGVRNQPSGPMRNLRSRAIFGVIWGVLAILAFFCTIILVGYSPLTILSSLNGYNNFLGEIEFRITDTIGAMQALTTPAFILFIGVGILTLIRRRDPLLLVVLVGLVLVLPWASRGVPKFILPCIPGLVLCAVVGFDRLWKGFSSPRLQRVLQAAVVVLLVLPWLVGIRVTYRDSAFGPGFEQRPFDRPDTQGVQVSLGLLEGGANFPTPEGPRSLWGHAAVLLGGGWREVVTRDQLEITETTRYAVENNIPLLAASRPGFFVVALWNEGFTTDDPRDTTTNPNDHEFVKRMFVDSSGNEITFFQTTISTGQVDDMPTWLRGESRVVMFGYPRTMRHLYEMVPNALQRLGNNSAVLDLTMLERVLAAN